MGKDALPGPATAVNKGDLVGDRLRRRIVVGTIDVICAAAPPFAFFALQANQPEAEFAKLCVRVVPPVTSEHRDCGE